MRFIFAFSILFSALALASGGGPISSGGGVWGSITGTLSSQTDLQNALNLKATLASPTFTGTVTTPNIGCASDGGCYFGTLDGTGTDSKRFNIGYTKLRQYVGTFGTSTLVSGATDVGIGIGGNTISPAVVLYTASSAGDVPYLRYRQSRGTVASPTATQNGDKIGQLDASGYASGFFQGFQLYASATENWSGSNQGTQVFLSTISTATNTLINRIVIDGVGNTNIKNGFMVASDKGVVTRYISDNTDNADPPSEAQLINSFGTPNSNGAGWIGMFDNNLNGITDNKYLIGTDGGNYYYVLMTEAQ